MILGKNTTKKKNQEKNIHFSMLYLVVIKIYVQLNFLLRLMLIPNMI